MTDLNIAQSLKDNFNAISYRPSAYDVALRTMTDVLDACRADGIDLKVTVDQNTVRADALTANKPGDHAVLGTIEVGKNVLHFALMARMFSSSSLYISANSIENAQELVKAPEAGMLFEPIPLIQAKAVEIPLGGGSRGDDRSHLLKKVIVEMGGLERAMANRDIALEGRPASSAPAKPKGP